MTLTVDRRPDVPPDPAVTAVLQGVCDGRGALVVVEGAAGSGRSRVLAGLAAAARDRGLTVRSARCSVAELADDGAVAAQLGIETPAAVLTVDDVQWCDRASVRSLGALARRIGDRPVLLAVTVDPAEWSGLDPELAGLVHAPWRQRWRLGPLDRAAVAQRCAAALGTVPPEIVDACVDTTAGVPGLLAELLAAVRDDPSPAAVHAAAVAEVGTAARRRADRHGAGAVLRLLAAVDTPVPGGLLAELLDTGPATAAAALDTAARLGLVTTHDDGAVAGPPLLRRSVRLVLGTVARDRARAAVARALAGDPDTWEQAADQLVTTVPAGSRDTVLVLRSCAARLHRAGRFGDAERVLRRALAEPPSPETRPAVLGELGAARLHRDPDDAVGHLTAAIERPGTDASRLQYGLQLAHGLAVLGRGAEAQQRIHAELARSGLGTGHELHRRAAAELLFVGLSSDDVLRDRRRPDRLPVREQRLSTATRIVTAAFAGQRADGPVEGIRHAMSGRLEPTDESGMGWLATASVLVWADDVDTARRALERAVAEARRWDAPMPLTTALWLAALVAVRSGRLADATELAGEAAGLARGRDWAGWEAGPSIACAELEQATGEPVPGGADGRDELPGQWVADLALAARGRRHLMRGDPAAAVADLTEAGRRLTAIGCRNPGMSDWRSAAAVALGRLDRAGEAAELVEQEIVLARAWGSPRVLAVALRRRGGLRGGPAGLTDLDAALEILGDGFPLERARTLLAAGTLHRAAHDAAAARASLTEAHRVAERCGAGRLLRRARDELLVVGGRPRVVRDGPPVVLTSGEERVARLAARGAGNADIAATLFLARRTVEAHLTSIYRKLGIRGRSQLPDALPPEEDPVVA